MTHVVTIDPSSFLTGVRQWCEENCASRYALGIALNVDENSVLDGDKIVFTVTFDDPADEALFIIANGHAIRTAVREVAQ